MQAWVSQPAFASRLLRRIVSAHLSAASEHNSGFAIEDKRQETRDNEQGGQLLVKRDKAAAKTERVDLRDLLGEAQARFGIRRFRPGQAKVLRSVKDGRNTLALMPTGAGKSLTYQLPALFLPKPVIVVSPLIALMEDQQEKAEKAGIVVEKLNSTLRAGEQNKAEHEIDTGVAQLIYVTPERLGDQKFLAEMNKAGGVSLLVVDEAHTISQWGHDFRPAFSAIGEARKILGSPPVLAVTATATAQVTQDILRSLDAGDANIIDTGIERGNLRFSVFSTVNDDAKAARVMEILKGEQGPGIIYTASVKSADMLFDLLSEHEVSVGRYHGKMKIRDREAVQESFMQGEHRVMIATKAFGLGIDKPDIRFVCHYEFPDSLETYYQEAGRAGRDGKPAEAVLLYRLEDKRIQTYFQAGRYPKAAELEKVYEVFAASPAEAIDTGSVAERSDVGARRTGVILNLMRDAGVIRRSRDSYCLASTRGVEIEEVKALLQTYGDRATSDARRLDEMMHYAQTPACRVQVIRAYFEEDLGEPCGRCDNCNDHPESSALRIAKDPAEEPIASSAEVRQNPSA